MLSIIVATDLNHAIGRNNELLWHLPADMAYFRKLTTGHPIVMGRKTYESIGRPLPNRENVVISRDLSLKIEGCVVYNSLETVLQHKKTSEEVFIIGGGEIYRQALPLTNRIYLTLVGHVFPDADTFFPELNQNDWILTSKAEYQADEKNVYPYSFLVYDKSNLKGRSV